MSSSLVASGRSEVGLERQVDNVFDVAEYVTKKLGERDDFKLVLPRFELTNVCFWYLPKKLRDEQIANRMEIDKSRLHKVSKVCRLSGRHSCISLFNELVLHLF